MLRRSFAYSLPRIFFLTLASLPAVSYSAEIGGTTVNSNTALMDGDTWNAGNFTITGGAVVNIPGMATLGYSPSAEQNLAGDGILRIDAGGTFSFATATSNDNLVLSGTVGILNNGTYDFASGGDLRLLNAGSSFTNNGLLLKSAASVGDSGDPSYIFPSTTTTGGSFLNTGDITVNAGRLDIAGGSSTSGTFKTGGSGTFLTFSGRWTELIGVSDESLGGGIGISNEDPATTTGGMFTANAATTVLDVKGDGLRLGSSIHQGIKLELNGNILRNDGILRLVTGTTTVQGTGSFENGDTGDFRLGGGTLALTSSDLTNNGLMNFNAATTTINGTGSVTITDMGTLSLSGGTLQADTTVTNNGMMTVTGTSGISGTVAVTNNATLTLGGGTTALTLAGNNLVNEGTAGYALLDGNVTINGTGRFINNGTFNHAYGGSNDNLIITGGATFENNGTFELQERGDIQITSTGLFENNGLLLKSVGGSDSSFIFQDATGLASTFVAADGSEVRSNAGTLHFGSGGTSDEGALWTADGGDLVLAGQWTGTVNGSSATTGKIRIRDGGNASVASNLIIGAGGLAFNVSNFGTVWNSANILTQGHNLTNNGTFFIADTTAKTLSGGGELLNATGASLTHINGTITFADDSIIRNQGNMAIGGGPVGYTGAGQVINDAAGTLDWTGGGIAVSGGSEFHNVGVLNISSSGNRTLSGDGVFSNDATGITNWTGTATLSIATGTTYTNDGTFNTENNGNRSFGNEGTFVNNGTFNHNVNGSDDNLGWNGTGEFVNNGLFGMNFLTDYQMEGGTTFTNAATGKLQVSSVSASEIQFFSFSNTPGTGTFDNQGTVEVLGGNFRLTTSAGGDAQFEDTTLVQNDGAGTLTGGTWVADSTATGLARINIQHFTTTGITTIGADAVVELTGAGATLDQLSSLTQVDGGLHINEKTFTPGGPLAIGGTGTLGGNGTINASTFIDGTLTPGASRGAAIGGISVTGNLGLGDSSQMNLQLGAALGVEDSSFNAVTTRMMIDALSDQDPTTEHDSVNVSGVLTLSNMMSILVEDAGVTYAYGQYFDLFDFASLEGIASQAEADAILTLPDLGPSYSWDTSLFVSKGIIFVVPEPSQAMLLITGLGGLLLRRKRTA